MAHVLLRRWRVDDMAGMEMAMSPTLADGAAYVGAWAVMMAAMMLPSALPMIRLYARPCETVSELSRQADPHRRVHARVPRDLGRDRRFRSTWPASR
jgi:predicted metal-binding membrane protein